MKKQSTQHADISEFLQTEEHLVLLQKIQKKATENPDLQLF